MKLDGHSRARAWETGKLERPDPAYVYVEYYPCADDSEAMRLYETFDSKQALETTSDKLSGAFRSMTFRPSSRLLQRMSFTQALRIAQGFATGTKGADFKMPIYDLAPLWTNELQRLDHCDLKPALFSTCFFVAALLTMRRYRPAVPENIWIAYNGLKGDRYGATGQFDGVYGLMQMRKEPLYTQSVHVRDGIGKALWFFEKQKDNQLIQRNTLMYEPENYLSRLIIG